VCQVAEHRRCPHCGEEGRSEESGHLPRRCPCVKLFLSTTPRTSLAHRVELCVCMYVCVCMCMCVCVVCVCVCVCARMCSVLFCWQSEVIQDNLNPVWLPFELLMRDVGSMTEKISISVYDHDKKRYVFMCVLAGICTCTRVCTCMYLRVCTRAYPCLRVCLLSCVCIHVYVRVCTFVDVYVPVHSLVCVSLPLYIYVCVCMRALTSRS
jgi:hypothetical protein